MSGLVGACMVGVTLYCSVLLAALAVVLAVSLVRVVHRRDPAAARADACCAGLMTISMGYLVLSLL